MRDRAEIYEEQHPGAARTEGLRRLSRLTWRVTQLSAVTAVGLATLFARAAPVQTTAGDGTPAPAVSTSPPGAAPSSSAPARTHRKRTRVTASATTRVTSQPGQAGSAPSKKATLAPPSSAPAAPPPSSAPAPAPTTSSASHGGG
jgi:hypothetical protein